MANQLTTTSALIDSELMDVNLKPEVVTLPFLTITVADDVYPFLSMLTITVGIFANLYGNTTSCSSSLLTANVISTDPCCKLLLHRKNQVLFMIPGPPYSYCFFCFFFAALFQFVQSSPVYNAFPFTLSCLRTFWISSLPFLSAAIHKGL